jgi:hypothetical protein
VGGGVLMVLDLLFGERIRMIGEIGWVDDGVDVVFGGVAVQLGTTLDRPEVAAAMTLEAVGSFRLTEPQGVHIFVFSKQNIEYLKQYSLMCTVRSVWSYRLTYTVPLYPYVAYTNQTCICLHVTLDKII